MSRSEKFDFPNRDGAQLSGRLELPENEPKAFAVFAHCFTCSKNVRAAAYISRELCRHGFAVLRFDFTGLGNSEGDFANTDFSSNVEDLVAAADGLRQQHRAPGLLIGHSLGGAAVLAAAPRIDEVQAVVTIAAPSDPAHVTGLFREKREEIEERGRATVELGGRSFTIRKEFLDDVEKESLESRVARMRKALLIFHSPTDGVVGIEHARKIFESAKHPKSFVSLDGADHLLDDKEDAGFVAATVAVWADRYIGRDAESRREPSSSEREEGEVLVVEEDGGLAQSIRAGKHALAADEPESVGGSGTGPTPYDLLLAALGACTSMTLRMYARRKEWPVDRISVELRHEKIHAEDCESCETREGKVDRIDARIEVRGDLDVAKRARLLEIAGKCPVHRTLEGEKEIRLGWMGEGE